jgi:hypothetical protein
MRTFKIRQWRLFPDVCTVLSAFGVATVSLPAQTVPHLWTNMEDVVSLNFQSLPGQPYRMEWTTNLVDPQSWTLSETLIAGNGEIMFAFDPFPLLEGKCYRVALTDEDLPPDGPVVRAENCIIMALDGNFGYLDTAHGRDVLVSTDPSGNPAFAVGDIKFNFPGVVSNGTYRLSMRWTTGTMGGTPWAFQVGSDSGTVTEGGAPSGSWHYFFPGQNVPDSDEVFTRDLAGTNPIDFSLWVNSPVAGSITVSGVGSDDFYVRVWDMSPSIDNHFAIEYFQLIPN